MSVKRRANSVMVTPASKRRRLDGKGFSKVGQTSQGTTEVGSKLLDSLRRTQDKSGRLVSTEFLRLPPRNNKEYYQQIKLPLSLHEIQAKLDNFQYGDMTSLESDLKRMVQNAKDFNVTGSKIYEDAERLRKAVTNFMVKHNPAYEDRGYHPQSTPLPDGLDDKNGDTEPVIPPKKETTPSSIKLKVNGASKPKSESGPPEETPVAESVDMRQEQLKIIEEMIELRDPEDANSEITLEFFEKPPKREYPDYYRLITHPTALKDIHKAVTANKISSWEAFITEIEYLWENARTYNEEGSFIHDNANKLRDWCLNRLSGVDGARDILPPKKLILNPPKNPSKQQTPRIKFTTMNKNVAQPGIVVDEEARRRQEEHVKAAARVQISRSIETPIPTSLPRAVSRESPHAITVRATSVRPPSRRSISVISKGPADEQETTQAESSQKKLSTPDVSETPQSPEKPKALTEDHQTEISMQPPAVITPQAQTVAQPAIAKPPMLVSTAFDRLVRDAGKGIKDALYQRIRAQTNPELRHSRPWSMNFLPDPSLTQHGCVVHLPSSQNWLRLTLWLSAVCLNRAQYRPVVSRDLAIVYPEQPGIGGQFEYHFKLQPGVNTVCVDVMATLNQRGEIAPEWPQERHDFERFVLTVNLLAPEP